MRWRVLLRATNGQSCRLHRRAVVARKEAKCQNEITNNCSTLRNACPPTLNRGASEAGIGQISPTVPATADSSVGWMAVPGWIGVCAQIPEAFAPVCLPIRTSAAWSLSKRIQRMTICRRRSEAAVVLALQTGSADAG